MDDSKSKNYNTILVSLISELIYDNSELDRMECYSYITNDLKINLQKDIFIEIIEKSKNFVHTSNQNDIGIKLTDKKCKEINDTVKNHSLDKHIDKFLANKNLSKELK